MERTDRIEQAGGTRERILCAAERLFAEHGVHVVSNRRVSEAAQQGNNAAVGYHFGTKADLVRAITRKHCGQIEETRARLLAGMKDPTDIGEWVACLVRPTTGHLARLGSPTWFARFCAQVMTDPALQDIMAEESLACPPTLRALEGLNTCLPDLPAEVRAERAAMSRTLILHTCAERERALATGTAAPRTNWHDTATGLIDAIVGIWTAPVTPCR
ncbi:MAG TPA: TetR family transcriptional regulator [Streptomyces sp.]|uniref:TetR/AcrR family transcriptional regulator n=1 Tax=Streptomyces sp. TaxID=1931 RepID=UPI002BC74F3A|nr:TetR family transcriptional regulator [Streptomyces sp.]HWU07749.1 TetR family transcriptional regulator [Streptomyces sp.]